MNTFDPVTHTFRINGVPVPSLTQALKAANIIDDAWYTEEARDRGTKVHLACQFLAEGVLDWDTLDPVIVPYVEGYQKFLDESGYIPGLVEQILFNEEYFFGTILDNTGLLYDYPSIVEIKSGTPEPWHKLQTAGQAACLKQHHRRFSLRLFDDGNYKLSDEHKDPNDLKVFLSAVAVAHWKRNTGGKSYDRSSPEIGRVA